MLAGSSRKARETAKGLTGFRAFSRRMWHGMPEPRFVRHLSHSLFLCLLLNPTTGNSVFFPVKRIEDPIGLLPAKLILGINKRGVHFFR
jgi:hypothetical protein